MGMLLGEQEREQPDLVLNHGGPDCGMRVPSTECRDNCVHESEQPVSGHRVRRERRLSVPLHPRFTVSVCLHVSPGIHCLIKRVLRQEAVHLTPSIRKHICTHWCERGCGFFGCGIDRERGTIFSLCIHAWVSGKEAARWAETMQDNVCTRVYSTCTCKWEVEQSVCVCVYLCRTHSLCNAPQIPLKVLWIIDRSLFIIRGPALCCCTRPCFVKSK